MIFFYLVLMYVLIVNDGMILLLYIIKIDK